MSNTSYELTKFGWSPYFQAQLSENEIETCRPFRVTAVHRDRIELAGPDGAFSITSPRPASDTAMEDVPTVGDWSLLGLGSGEFHRILERKSLFKRRASGESRQVQLIAANVDTIFVVSSCDHDFNPARLERYLALAHEAGVTPVVVLTKADLADDPETFRREAEKLMPGLLVECVNATEKSELEPLELWCGPGQTVVVLGSSGVGKSTLVNSLGVDASQATRGVRQDDTKGRHTTTGRSMHSLRAGGWLIDTPGMRELQLTDARDGIGDVFADIETLAALCRFTDCAHKSEPGCAVTSAIADGKLEAGRLGRYRKLLAEDMRNTESVAERRTRGRKLSQFYRSVKTETQTRKNR